MYCFIKLLQVFTNTDNASVDHIMGAYYVKYLTDMITNDKHLLVVPGRTGPALVSFGFPKRYLCQSVVYAIISCTLPSCTGFF